MLIFNVMDVFEFLAAAHRFGKLLWNVILLFANASNDMVFLQNIILPLDTANVHTEMICIDTVLFKTVLKIVAQIFLNTYIKSRMQQLSEL